MKKGVRVPSRFFLLCLIVLSALGMPSIASAAEKDPRGVKQAEVKSAAILLDQSGDYGYVAADDRPSVPGVRCWTYLTSPKGLYITVGGPEVGKAPLFDYFYPYDAQLVGWRVYVFQVLNGGDVAEVGHSTEWTGYAYYASDAFFYNQTVGPFPVGPQYIVAVQVYWHDLYGAVTGQASYYDQYYAPRVARSSGTTDYPVMDSCYSPVKPSASVTPNSGRVGTRINYSLAYFPLGVSVSVKWDGKSAGSVTTDGTGRATGTFKIPASTAGAHKLSWSYGNWKVSRTITVIPRLKLSTTSASTGSTVTVSLTGFAARETVKIKWKKGTSYSTIAQVTTSSSGSGKVDIVVPTWAVSGKNYLRAYGSTGTTASASITITVISTSVHQSDVSPVATESTATATMQPSATSESASATPTLPPSPTDQPTIAPTETLTAQPSPTDKPTEAPPDPTSTGAP